MLANQVAKVQANLGEQAGVLLGRVHAPRPSLAVLLLAAELPGEDGVEGVDLLLGPLDTRAHHGGREAGLEAADRVADDGEVDKRDFPDVLVQVALEDALPVSRRWLAKPSATYVGT